MSGEQVERLSVRIRQRYNAPDDRWVGLMREVDALEQALEASQRLRWYEMLVERMALNGWWTFVMEWVEGPKWATGDFEELEFWRERKREWLGEQDPTSD